MSQKLPEALQQCTAEEIFDFKMFLRTLYEIDKENQIRAEEEKQSQTQNK